MPFEAADTHMSLVADIGGTNTRVALAQGPTVERTSIRRYRNADYEGLGEVLVRYLEDTGTAPAQITGACVAAAGPVHDGIATLTNLDWRIDRDVIRRALTAEKVAVLNDLQAQGHAIGQIAADDLIDVVAHPGAGFQAAALVVGIGTGFNACPVFETGHGRFAPPSEAGHVSLPFCDAALAPVMEAMVDSSGFASIEEVLSGRGIAHLHSALNGGSLSTPEVMEALAAGDPQAEATARLFVRVMGTVVGDLALSHLPFGGIYLVGGVTRAFLPYLDRFDFADAMQDKGRFSDFMQQFSVQVVVDDYAALTGCASHLSRI